MHDSAQNLMAAMRSFHEVGKVPPEIVLRGVEAIATWYAEHRDSSPTAQLAIALRATIPDITDEEVKLWHRCISFAMGMDSLIRRRKFGDDNTQYWLHEGLRLIREAADKVRR